MANLPVPLTSFIGREKESAEIKQLLAFTRLLTLVGPGGAGKARLAIQVAAGLAEAAVYQDGVVWVEMAAAGDATAVPQAVAAALGLHDAAGRPLSGCGLMALARPRSTGTWNGHNLDGAMAFFTDEATARFIPPAVGRAGCGPRQRADTADCPGSIVRWPHRANGRHRGTRAVASRGPAW